MLWRVLLFFTQSRKQNYIALREENLHKKAVKVSYLVLYGVIAFMAVSGLVIHFYDALDLAKETAHDIKEVHELVYNVILIFVPLHIAGVVIADITNEKCIVSDMINGGEK